MTRRRVIRGLAAAAGCGVLLFLSPYAAASLMAGMWLVKRTMTTEPSIKDRGTLTFICAVLLCLPMGLFSRVWRTPAVLIPGAAFLAWLFRPETEVDALPPEQRHDGWDPCRITDSWKQTDAATAVKGLRKRF